MKIESDRKSNRKKDKPFAPRTGSGGNGGACWMQSEILELTQPEVVKTQIYKSSSSDDN